MPLCTARKRRHDRTKGPRRPRQASRPFGTPRRPVAVIAVSTQIDTACGPGPQKEQSAPRLSGRIAPSGKAMIFMSPGPAQSSKRKRQYRSVRSVNSWLPELTSCTLFIAPKYDSYSLCMKVFSISSGTPVFQIKGVWIYN